MYAKIEKAIGNQERHKVTDLGRRGDGYLS